MDKLSTNNSLFKRLKDNPPEWWKNLRKDKDLSFQIRKNNSIDVYCHGGSIVKNLTLGKQNHFKGEVHFKYIPIKGGKQDYVPYSFDADRIEFGEVKNDSAGCFSGKILKILKSNISKYYPGDSEKAIQYDFIKNDPFFIDSEFQGSIDRKNVRIDLVRIDVKERKIVFVEVKTIGDRRLFNEEIKLQLEDYKKFITARRSELLIYYKKIFEIKKNLGLLAEELLGEELDSYQVLEKPLLLFGDCEQSWIDKFSKDLDEKIKSSAVGCYYFGKPAYTSELIEKTNRNKHIF